MRKAKSRTWQATLLYAWQRLSPSRAYEWRGDLPHHPRGRQGTLSWLADFLWARFVDRRPTDSPEYSTRYASGPTARRRRPAWRKTLGAIVGRLCAGSPYRWPTDFPQFASASRRARRHRFGSPRKKIAARDPCPSFVPWLQKTLYALLSAGLLLPVPVFAAATWQSGIGWTAFVTVNGTTTAYTGFTAVDGSPNSTLAFTPNLPVAQGTTIYVFSRPFTTDSSTMLSTSLNYSFHLKDTGTSALVTVTFSNSVNPELKLGPVSGNNQFTGTATGSNITLPMSSANSVNYTVRFSTDGSDKVAASAFTLTLNGIHP
jgi:hypothetical protein